MNYLNSVHGKSDLDFDGYIVLTRELGANPDDHNGENFRRFRQTPIVRLNYGYFPNGTIPRPELYTDFAQRVRNFVEASPGCSRWIIGNEPNHAQERPQGQPILPHWYAECFTECRDAIRSLQFHTGDQVLVAAVAPWNIDTKYDGNPSGDWIQYFEDMQDQLGIAGCDGFAIHTYTREQTPSSVASLDRMDPPFEMYHNGFRTFTDWMHAILPRFQGLPVYCTEFCVAGVPWRDVNTGCVQQGYLEVDQWNRLHASQQIEALTIYRWEHDQWEFKDKPQVQADFNEAVARGYTVPPGGNPEPPEEDDMLLNPSFEEGWYNQTPDGILVLPEHWRAEYKEGGDPWFRPEIKPNEEFVTDGQYSIRAFPPEHSRGYFGIYQELDAEPGQWYRFTADARVESKPDGRLAAFVGIQPWGASILERQMVWGKETQEQLEFQTVEVIAQAFGGRIRVAMGATNDFASRNNTVWWDNAKLELWECDGGTDPEPPDPPVNGECLLDWQRLEDMINEAVRYQLNTTRLITE